MTNKTNKPKAAGLVIRWFDGGYFLCDGKDASGNVPPGGKDLCVGNTVKWFRTYEEAVALRSIIESAYGIVI